MEMNTVKILLGAVLALLIHVFNVFVFRPRSMRAKLQKQGIKGPSPHFYFGNIPEIKSILLQVQSAAPATEVTEKDEGSSLSHNWPFTLFPHVQKWIKQYGELVTLACLINMLFSSFLFGAMNRQQSLFFALNGFFL